MKSTKLLAVLAGAAMFTACSQEELVETNNAPQQMEVIVGAKLVGTDVSLNVSMGVAQSRWAGGEAKWEKEDLVGLGWMIYNSPTTDQLGKTPNKTELYANHKYNYDETTGSWTTQGNLYEGWYCAYYPWDYMPKVAQKIFTVNPVQATSDQVKHYSERLFISGGRQFITEAEVDTESNTLNTRFEMLAAVKAFRVKTNPAEESSFKKNEIMQAKKIEYITFNTGDETKKIFATSLKFNPNNLPVWDEDAEKEENVNAFYNQLYAQKKPVLSVADDNWTSTLTTEFEGEGKQAAFGDNRLVAYAVPATADLDINKVSIKIGIEGGAYFLIDKDDKNEKNQKALQQFVDAYCGEEKEGCGAMTKIDATDGTNWAMTLDVELHDDIFFTDFSQIGNYEDWKNAVDMVDILGRDAETFQIVGRIDFAEGIYMPKNGCELTVLRGNKADLDEKESSSATLANYYFNITGDMTSWPENLNSDQIKVVVDGATVEDAHLISAHQIVNKGTLNVPDNQTLTSASNTLPTSKIVNEGEINLGYKSKVSRVDNTSGRINVIYGSYVELLTGTEAGEIAYIVDEEDAAAPLRIKDVIATTGQSEHALVNVLVFDKENVASFDFTKSTSAKPNDNPYYDNSSDATEFVLELNGVSLEINGVAVSSSSETTLVTVKDVAINGGRIENIEVAGSLTVKGGNVVADVAKVDGALTIEAGQGQINAATIGSVNITSGNFTINAETIDGNVIAKAGENYFNVETIKGTVNVSNTGASVTHFVGTTINDDVTLNGNWNLTGVTVESDLTVNGVVKATDLAINGTLNINKGAEVVVNSEKIIQINSIVNDGGELTSNNDIKVENITLQNKSVTTLGADWENTVWYTGSYVHNNSSVNGYVKKCPSTTNDLQAALDGAVAGETIYLSEKVADYGTITIGELKDVIIEGAENSVVIFKTDANTKIENVTLEKVNFAYTGATVDCGVVINENAQIDNLVLENCTFTGTGEKKGRGLSGYNNSASIVIKNCDFKDLGYPIYAWGSYESLTIEECNFINIKSWAVMPQSGFNGDLTVTGCNFIDCLGGGLVKAGTLTAGHTFTFTNNTVTNCTVAGDHNWFSINTSAGTKVISGNKKDGEDWLPSASEGLN